METPLDQQFDQEPPKQLSPDMYAGFWHRLGAVVLDGVVLVPATVVIIINTYKWKSLPLFFACSMVYVIYKVFMEYRYGATVGKMALGIRVVDKNREMPSLQAVLGRCCFQFLFLVITVLHTVHVFSLPGFADADTFMAYSRFVQQHNEYSFFSTYLPGLLSLADGIVMVSDPEKRSIHDRIGKTFVIKK